MFFLFSLFDFSRCLYVGQMAGDGGWKRLIVEHVPALREHSLEAPWTPLTRGYRTGPPRHKCLRKQADAIQTARSGEEAVSLCSVWCR